MEMVKKYTAVVIGTIFANINRLADNAHYSFPAVFPPEFQRQSSLQDREEAEMKSDQAAKLGKDGN